MPRRRTLRRGAIACAVLGAVALGLVLATATPGSGRPAGAASIVAHPPAGTIVGSAPAGSGYQTLAALTASHRVFSSPGGRPFELVSSTRPITGEQTVLPVLGSALSARTTWLRVRLPGRPNGLTGWIRAGGVRLEFTAWRIVVDTRARRVHVFAAGQLVKSFAAVVGAPATPTPKGDFFVEETVAVASTAVGYPYALALSARSNVLQEFDGGPGQIALHGLDNVGGVLGTAVSHGCVRLDTADISWLAKNIDPGVPVTIN